MAKMQFLQKFESFEYDVLDNDTTTKPKVRPGERTAPSKPSPFRRDKPSVSPRPKAELEDVVNKFINLMNDRNEDIEKFI